MTNIIIKSYVIVKHCKIGGKFFIEKIFYSLVMNLGGKFLAKFSPPSTWGYSKGLYELPGHRSK
jgi:hypothetical protein